MINEMVCIKLECGPRILFVKMIALKKPKATKFSDHRTISLIAYRARIVARMLRRRTERKIEDVLGKDQFGFKGGNETGDAIGTMRIMSQRTWKWIMNCVLALLTGRRRLTV
jgi:hypothetical protein